MRANAKQPMDPPRPSPAARVSVVVPSYRRAADLRACLSAVATQTLAPLEVLVVLRTDDAEGEAVATAAPGVRIVTVDEPGQVAALNRGCLAAAGDLIAITDDDARPRANWLRAIAARFATDARIGAVGGRDVVHHGDEIDDGVAERVGRVLWWGRRLGNHHLRSHLQDVDFLKGANMAFRKIAWQPFDPRLRGEGAQVCNDLEATWSVRRRGWRVVYDPVVIVDHHPAQRHDDDRRDARSAAAELAEAHNETYALLRHAAWWQRPILLAYQVVIGKRQAPGLVLAARPRSRGTRSRVVGLTAARLSALSTLRAERRSVRSRCS